MSRIIVNSSELQTVADDIDMNCNGLWSLNEDDDVTDFYFYTTQIRQVLMRLNEIIEDAEKVEG